MTYQKVLIIVLGTIIVLCLTACGKTEMSENKHEEMFLQAAGNKLIDNEGEGKAITLRGTNAGGYLLQELWMTPTSSSSSVNDQMDIINVLTTRFGEEKAYELIELYEDTYWTEQDFKNCADMGMNCIRLPFWYRNLVDEEGHFYGYDASAKDPYAKAFKRIDWFVETAGKYGLYVILDCHGAPGSQNGSDHSGEDGGNEKKAGSHFFFGEEAATNQQLFYEMWKVIAARYKDYGNVAGYDVMNEPFCTYRYNSGLSDEELHTMLWLCYDTAYRVIREVDQRHIVIMEAVWNSGDLPNPEKYGWENVVYEYHNYLYDDYDNDNGKQISNMDKKIQNINKANYGVPSYLGEFNYFNNYDAWDEGLKLLNESGLSWTTWTYKTVASYGNWGLYHHATSMNDGIDISTASYKDIKAAWSKVGTNKADANTKLIEIMKKHLVE